MQQAGASKAERGRTAPGLFKSGGLRPFVDDSRQHFERHRAAFQNRVVESAQVEARAELRLSLRAQAHELEVVAAGTLTFLGAAALPAGQNLTVGSDAVVVFSSGYTGPITASGASSAAPAAPSAAEGPALVVAQAAPATAAPQEPQTTAGETSSVQALALVAAPVSAASPLSAAAKPSVAAAWSLGLGRSLAGAKPPARSSTAGATRQLAPALWKPNRADTVSSAAALWNIEQFATTGQPTKKASALRAQVVDLALAKWW